MLIVYHKLYTEHQMLHETCVRHILVCCWKCYDTCKNYGNISWNLQIPSHNVLLIYLQINLAVCCYNFLAVLCLINNCLQC